MEQTTFDPSPYVDVYVALKAIEPGARAVPPGTRGAIHRTLDYLRTRRDEAALARLERIALLVETLWHCARSGDEAVRACSHLELAKLSGEWLAEAPMLASATPEPVIA